MPTLLVIDDDPHVLTALTIALADGTVAVATAASAAAGVEAFAAGRPDAVLCDVHLPDASGLDLLARLRELDPAVPVVLMTGHGTAETAIEAMRRGAFDYVLKPVDPDALAETMGKAFEVSRLMRVPAVVGAGDGPDAGDEDRLIGQSPGMQEVFKAIGRVAPTDATVLILGESGTGKEMVARAVVHYSRRAGKPFQAINCAAIPDALLESELFGHEKGSFTGADRKRVGRFEQCDGGTLFLDEIGDMSLLTQAKILRVLQDQRFERVGGSETVRTNVRLVAATHRNLEGMIAAGTFREDLYYRLNVCPVRLPPLRDRPEDIPALAEYFVRRSAPELGKTMRGLAPEAVETLKAYRWPGNVRELQSCIKQALIRAADGPLLASAFLPDTVRTRPAATPAGAGADPAAWVAGWVRRRLQDGGADLHAELLAVVEKQLLTEAFDHAKGNLSLAARMLGLSRPTVRAKLAQHGLTLDREAHVRPTPAPVG